MCSAGRLRGSLGGCENSWSQRVDTLLGDGIEAAVSFKHRRRLRRLGWDHVFEPSDPGVWARGEPPPREGCELEVLIDGANALPEIARRLEQAKHYVHITGWHLAPSFELVKGSPQNAIGVLLAELADRIDVRVLVWSGAPMPGLSPDAGQRSPRRSKT